MFKSFQVYTVILFILILHVSCDSGKTKRQKIDGNAAGLEVRELKTGSGKEFIVQMDYSKGASICKVQVVTSGFSVANTEHKFGDIDPVSDIFLADLDNNGFEEIYIVTTSAGSGSYSTIYGVASNTDKSTSVIYVRQISELGEQKAQMFKGFMGHNSFTIETGKLINTLPVYKEGDSNAKPTGGIREVEYELIAGEAGWILEPRMIVH